MEHRHLERDVRALLEEMVSSGYTAGAQAVIYDHGEKIVSAVAGYTSGDRTEALTEAHLFPVYSSGKAFLTTLAHIAVQKGQISYDTPIAEVWSGFGAKGKEGIRLWHVLSHRSGICQLPDVAEMKDFTNWETMCDLLASLPLAGTPGGATSYRSLAYTWLAGEPLQLATGKPLRELLRDGITRPLGLEEEFSFGLTPDLLPKAVLFGTHPTLPRERPSAKRCWLPLSGIVNDPDIRRAVLPAFNSFATANALARHAAALLDPVEGIATPLLSPETLARASRLCRAEDCPIPERPGTWEIFGLGYVLRGLPGEESRVIGHSGFGGSQGLVDLVSHRALGFTLTTGNLDLAPVNRLTRLAGLTAREW